MSIASGNGRRADAVVKRRMEQVQAEPAADDSGSERLKYGQFAAIASEKARHRAAQFLAHGYRIEGTGETLLLQRGEGETLFIHVDGGMYKGISCM